MQNETGQIRRVLMKHARDAFISQEKIDAEWRALNYLDAPEFGMACAQSDRLAEILSDLGYSIDWTPAKRSAGNVSVFVRGNALRSEGGAAFCRMGQSAKKQI